MRKRILITGSTDGIGLETARHFLADDHHVLLHGRSVEKLAKVYTDLSEKYDESIIDRYVADLSRPSEVDAFADAILKKHDALDVLINNAGVFKLADPLRSDGLDLRFVVNTLAPFQLTTRLLPLIGQSGRVVNLSSAAQAPVDLQALRGKHHLSDGEAYAQSKLAMTMWSLHLARTLPEGPAIIAVNPGSFLASKMVKEAYGQDGKDLSIGAHILAQAALSETFANASGRYFDNDSGRFANPHPDALNIEKQKALMSAIEELTS